MKIYRRHKVLAWCQVMWNDFIEFFQASLKQEEEMDSVS